LERIDAVTRRVRDAARPVTFRAAEAEERRAVFGLRARVVIERGWLSPSELPEGLERDRFDEAAMLVGGWLETTLVAAARLIWPGSPDGSPLAAEFGIELPASYGIVHVDRICVAREHSDSSSRLAMALMCACWLECRTRGYCVVSGLNTAEVIRLYRRFGFTVQVIGDAKTYFGEERFPVLLDPLSAADVSIERMASRRRSGSTDDPETARLQQHRS
jgi:N-acyl-L-homoserine lactone synthetase